MTFRPGEKMLHFSVTVLEDVLPEDTEVFYVRLQTPGGGAEIGPNSGVIVYILSNDGAHGVIQFADVSANYGLHLFCLCFL